MVLLSYVHLPFLATLRSIKIAIFGEHLLLTEMQNITRNGKKVTEVLYRVADQSFFIVICDLKAQHNPNIRTLMDDLGMS